PITNYVMHYLCKKTAVVIGHHTDKKGSSARGTGDLLGFAATQLTLDGAPCSNKFTVETIMRNAEAPEPMDVRFDFKSAPGECGELVLDTAEVIMVGTVKERNSAEVQGVRSVLRANPGISSN